MTAAGLVVTDLSHLGVGLNGRGDLRGPVRFAVASKPGKASAHDVIAYQRVALGRQVRSVASVNQPGPREDLWQTVTDRVVQASLKLVLEPILGGFLAVFLRFPPETPGS